MQSTSLFKERYNHGAPNDQFVEKCIIMPQLMKIYVNKAFSGVFQYCWEKIICSFFPARNVRARKIKLVGFPANCKLSSQQAEQKNHNFLHRTSKWAWQKASNLHFSGGGRGGGAKGGIHLTFSTFTHQARLEMLENIIYSKTDPSA